MSRGARFVFSKIPVICVDALLAVACFLVAFALRNKLSPVALGAIVRSGSFAPYVHLAMLAPVVRVICATVTGVYDASRSRRIAGETFFLFESISLGTAVIIIVAFMYRGAFRFRDFPYSRYVFVMDWMLNLFVVVGIHALVHAMQDELRRRGVGAERVAVQGVGETARSLVEELERFPEAGYKVVGLMVDEGAPDRVRIGSREYPRVGGTGNVLEAINSYGLDEIILTAPGELGDRLMEFIEECGKVDVVVKLVPELYGILFRRKALDEMAGLPVIQVNEIAIAGWSRTLKRAEDMVLSTLFLMLLAPLFAVVAAVIKLDSRGPVFFKQARVGKNGRLFRLYKFRSMVENAESLKESLAHLNVAEGHIFKIRDDPRITRAGRFLRRANIDELPQLYNVFKGEMSLVGPRPPVPGEVARYERWQRRRFSTTPGITGLWQVSRTGHSFEEMLKWDIYYIENWSLWLDLKVLVKTIGVILTGKGSF